MMDKYLHFWMREKLTAWQITGLPNILKVLIENFIDQKFCLVMKPTNTHSKVRHGLKSHSSSSAGFGSNKRSLSNAPFSNNLLVNGIVIGLIIIVSLIIIGWDCQGTIPISTIHNQIRGRSPGIQLFDSWINHVQHINLTTVSVSLRKDGICVFWGCWSV